MVLDSSVGVPAVSASAFSRDSTLRGISQAAPDFSEAIGLEPLGRRFIIATAVILVDSLDFEGVARTADTPEAVKLSSILIVGASVINSVLSNVLLGEVNLTVILSAARDHERADDV